MPIPGWYRDPSGPERLRYWDGQRWTESLAEAPPVNEPPAGASDPAGPRPYADPNPARPSAPDPSPRADPSPSTRPAAPGPWERAWLVITILVVLGLLASFAFSRMGGLPGGATGPSERPAPMPTFSPLPAPPEDSQPSAIPSSLRCYAGNGNQARSAQQTYASTGVTYEGVEGWDFAFDRRYWTWLDDYSAMGSVSVDGGGEAGIVLGGVRFENGFGDQATAGPTALGCLADSMALDGFSSLSRLQGRVVDLNGMPTWHHSGEILTDQPRPLVVNVYVIDSGQPGKWAQIVTFARKGSSAEPRIAEAMRTVRHV